MSNKGRIGILFFSFCILTIQGCSDAQFASKQTTEIQSTEVQDQTQAFDEILNQQEQQLNIDPPAQKTPQDYQAQCDRARFVANLLGNTYADGSAINNVIGSIIGLANNLTSVQNVDGSVILVGDGSGDIDLVKDIRGSVILCSLSVVSLQNIIGSVIVVHGDINAIDGNRGSVIVFDGQVGTVNNSIGSVLEL